MPSYYFKSFYACEYFDILNYTIIFRIISSMDVKSLCLDFVDLCVAEFIKEENKNKVKCNILDPCIEYMVNQFYPYIIATCIIFILTFLLAIAIFFMLVRERFK